MQCSGMNIVAFSIIFTENIFWEVKNMLPHLMNVSSSSFEHQRLNLLKSLYHAQSKVLYLQIVH